MNTEQSVRPRILLITRNLPPLVGGMERLNWHMAEELARHAEVRVIGPEGAAASAPAGVRVLEVPLKPLWRFLLAAQWQAWRMARKWRPQIVLAGSGLTAPLVWLAARVVGARTAVYVHGLDLAVSHPVYKTLWLRFIRGMDRVIANSQATATLAINAGVDAARIGIVHPGVDLPEEGRDEKAAEQFRSKHGLGTRPILLSVGRLTQRKGLREFVSQVLPEIVAQKPGVLLVVIGATANDALRAESQTPQSIQAAAEAAGVGDNLKFLGAISDPELLAAFQAADVHIFPVQHIPDDPEGFGMVAVEAAAHGLPTVAYATGGVVDAVAQGQSGYLVPPGNTSDFADRVLKILQQPLNSHGLRAHAARFAWPCFADELMRQLPMSRCVQRE